MSMHLTHPQNVSKKREKINMRYSCGAVVGHGQKCEPNYQCDACAAKQKYIPRIEKLEAALTHIYAWYPISTFNPHQTIKEIKEFARKALEGKDD